MPVMGSVSGLVVKVALSKSAQRRICSKVGWWAASDGLGRVADFCQKRFDLLPRRRSIKRNGDQLGVLLRLHALNPCQITDFGLDGVHTMAAGNIRRFDGYRRH